MAQRVQALHPGVTWWCPQLPASPAQAIDLLLQGTADWPRGHMAVMGSSLGGFYAAWLSAHLSIPAVLINPAVHPSRDLARYIGEHPVWQDPAQSIFFEPAHVQELVQLESQPPVTLKAGDSLFIPEGVAHTAKNVGATTASELATYIVKKNTPLLILSK